MASEALIAESWKLACEFYAARVRMFPRAYSRDKLWDVTVDALLLGLDHCDGSGEFRKYFREGARMCWRGMLRECRRQKRRLFDEEPLQRRLNVSRDDNGQDRIELPEEISNAAQPGAGQVRAGGHPAPDREGHPAL